MKAWGAVTIVYLAGIITMWSIDHLTLTVHR